MLLSSMVQAQLFTEADSIRGSVTKERVWWDLTHYNLNLTVNPEEKYFSGYNEITYTVLEAYHTMQIDLQAPLQITEITQEGQSLTYESKGNAHYVRLPSTPVVGTQGTITVYYEGHPHEALRAPWDGGITWTTDGNGHPFIASSCQGIGASIWWPCKDHMYDEVDSMDIRVTTPEHLMDVSNGRLVDVSESPEAKTKTFHWKVRNPINNYGVNLSVGDYVHFEEVYEGERGALDVSYYVLRDNLQKAKLQFEQVPKMLEAFEHWFGPYPFYEDGFKIVEVPYLGMEHQSAVTYGNKYMNGYLGRDLSDSGWGLKFDFIIIHESGHEWWANNITYRDIADMWIHESFTAYSEALFLEYYYGKKAGLQYIMGVRRMINNDHPIIGPYGVNVEGSGDMYYKGSNMLHTLRQIANNDEQWRSMLRGLNERFYHQTVTTDMIETYMAEFLDLDLDAFFDQYLRHTERPTLEYYYKDGYILYRWNHVVKGFSMPVKIWIDQIPYDLSPQTRWKRMAIDSIPEHIVIDQNFYVVGTQIIR